MQLRVLSSHGSEFHSIRDKVAKDYHPVGFLLNRSVVLEAGTLCGALTLSELMAIRAVFITHAHLDHIQGLASLAENIFGKLNWPIEIFGLEKTIATLREHFFNDQLWPDFTQLPSPSAPIFRYQTVAHQEPVVVEGLTFTPIAVNHAVPTAGFIVEDDHAAIVFSGDTHGTDEIWEHASRIPHLKAAFIECTFPNRLSALAAMSGHLTPDLIYQEFLKIKRLDIPLYLYHMKPLYLEEIGREIEMLKKENVHLLDDGQLLTF